MAREITKKCDICKKPTERIVGKLLFVPTLVQNFAHSNYTHHADVGECCQSKLLNGFAFTLRTSAAEYHARRKAS